MMNQIIVYCRFVWVLMLVLILVSCAQRTVKSTNGLFIARDVPFQLLAENVFSENINLTQKVTMQYGEKKNTFLTRVESGPQGFVVVAMSELGQTIFTLKYANGELTSSVAAFANRLPDLKYLLADLQIIYWPLALLQDQFESPVLLRELPGDVPRRILQRANQTIVDVKYSKDVSFYSNVEFTHHERGYIIRAEVLAPN